MVIARPAMAGHTMIAYPAFRGKASELRYA